MHEGLLLWGDALAAAGDLQKDESDAAAIQHREGEDVDDGQVDGEEGGEVEEDLPAGLLDDFAGGLGDADGAGDIGAGAALEPGDDLVAGQEQRVEGGRPAFRDGFPGRETLLLSEGVEGGDLDAGGSLVLGRGPAGVDGDRLDGAVRVLDGEVDGLAQVESDGEADLADVADLLAVDLEDDVAGLEAGFLGGGLGDDVGYLGEAHVHVAGDHEGDGEEEDGEDEVHAGAGGEDEETDPAGLGGQAVGVGGVLLAQEADEASQREPVDGVYCAAPGEAPYAWGVAEAGLQDLDAGELGGDVVSELVDDDEDDEDAGEGEDGVEDEVHALPSPHPGHPAEQRSKGAKEQSRERASQRAIEPVNGRSSKAADQETGVMCARG